MEQTRVQKVHPKTEKKTIESSAHTCRLMGSRIHTCNREVCFFRRISGPLDQLELSKIACQKDTNHVFTHYLPPRPLQYMDQLLAHLRSVGSPPKVYIWSLIVSSCCTYFVSQPWKLCTSGHSIH